MENGAKRPPASGRPLKQELQKENPFRFLRGILLCVLVTGQIHFVFLTLPVLHTPHCLTEPLKMHNLPGAEILDNVCNIRVIAHAKNIVVGCASLLLGCNRERTT